MDEYTRVVEHLDLKGIAVEAGSGTDHGSTPFLAEHFIWQKIEFHTADPDPIAYRKVIDFDGVIAHNERAEKVIAGLNNICFGYLDGYDIGDVDKEESYQNRYRRIGYGDFSLRECAESHLKQAMLIEERSADKCVVIFDDTNFRWNKIRGKGALAVPYLIAKGFQPIDAFEEMEDSYAAWVVLRRDK